MRDPKRIKEVTMALMECWSKAPDLRFGQLVSNIHYAYSGGDMFFPEDTQWLMWIRKFEEEHVSNFQCK